MTEKLVTIAIASYNNSQYIERCIDSVINQTYKNLEVLIVDDGSTDDTMRRIKKYNAGSRIKIISKENRGLSSVRQMSLELARGDYISFIDADDYLTSTFVEKMLTKLMSDNSDICVCSTKFVDEEGRFDVRKSKVMSCEDSVKPIITANWCNDHKGISKKIHLSDSWTKMYSMSMLRKSGVTFNMPKGLNGTDTVFNRKLVLHCPAYSTIKDELYVHVIYKSSAVHRKNKDLLSSFMFITEQLVIETQKIGKLATYKEYISSYYYGTLFNSFYDVYNENKGKGGIFKVMYQKHIDFADRLELNPVRFEDMTSFVRKGFFVLLYKCNRLLPVYFKIYNLIHNV